VDATGYRDGVLAPGDVLDDRYRLEGRVAAGGMGDVWRATDTVLGRTVAVKMLLSGRAGDAGFEERFRQEARSMAALRHPGVADVYDYGSAGEDAYLVMAYVEGQPLSERIAEAGRLDPATTMSIVAQTAQALEAVHTAGITHRDVKPGNLIIQPDGSVVLVDFGVARSADSAALTGVDEVIGTALYIAPEQISKRPTGPATDIYALGAVAYHCLAGNPPFDGDNALVVAMNHLTDEPPPLPADVPAPVRDVVAAAMAKDPADRYPTAAAMAEAAQAAATGTAAGPTATIPMPVAAAGPTAAGDRVFPIRTASTERRRPRFTAAWALLLLALAGLGLAAALGLPDALTPGPSDPPASPQAPQPGSGGPQGGKPGATRTPAPGQPGAASTGTEVGGTVPPDGTGDPSEDGTGTDPPDGGTGTPPATGTTPPGGGTGTTTPGLETGAPSGTGGAQRAGGPPSRTAG